jgi:hypothetical protein
MSKDVVTVRVWQMEERPLALKCARALPATVGGTVLFCWIPLGLCTHISRRRNPGEIWPELIITLPAWKARELNLEEMD